MSNFEGPTLFFILKHHLNSTFRRVHMADLASLTSGYPLQVVFVSAVFFSFDYRYKVVDINRCRFHFLSLT